MLFKSGLEVKIARNSWVKTQPGFLGLLMARKRAQGLMNLQEQGNIITRVDGACLKKLKKYSVSIQWAGIFRKTIEQIRIANNRIKGAARIEGQVYV